MKTYTSNRDGLICKLFMPIKYKVDFFNKDI